MNNSLSRRRYGHPRGWIRSPGRRFLTMAVSPGLIGSINAARVGEPRNIHGATDSRVTLKCREISGMETSPGTVTVYVNRGVFVACRITARRESTPSQRQPSPQSHPIWPPLITCRRSSARASAPGGKKRPAVRWRSAKAKGQSSDGSPIRVSKEQSAPQECRCGSSSEPSRALTHAIAPLAAAARVRIRSSTPGSASRRAGRSRCRIRFREWPLGCLVILFRGAK